VAYDISASRNRYYGGSQLPHQGVIVIVKEKRGVRPQKGGTEMEWQMILALVVVAPLILFPVVFIWYLTIGGLIAALRERQKVKAAVKERGGAEAHQKPAKATAGRGKH